MKNLFALSLSCCISSYAFAETWTVDDDGKADFNNIQAAVDAASDGDEILVMPGIYQSSGSEAVVDMRGKSLKLTGNSNAQNVIIDGSLVTPGILCTGGEIENFTIQNCYRASGGGIFIESGSPLITDCIIENNSANYGGGVMAQSGYPQFYNCTFNNNAATQRGGGVRGTSISVQFDNCVFSSNTAQRGGGVYLSQNFNSAKSVFTNCSFQNNTVSSLGGGVAINSAGTTTLFDTCSFISNESTGLNGGQGSGGGMYNDSSSPSLVNCIFDSNIADSNGGGLYNWSSSPLVDQCQFTNNVAASGGGIRSYNGTGPTVADSSFCENIPSNIAGVHIDDGTNCLANSCTDLDNNGISDECEGSVFTVDDDGPANFDNIQAAIDAASNGYEIIVLPGTYTADNNPVFTMSQRNIWLHSSDGPEATIIDGQNAQRCAAIFSMPDGALIEGFTFTNGLGYDGGAIYMGYSDGLVINNCTFINNLALNRGGGIFSYSSPSSPNMLTLTNCTFENNRSYTLGGAISLQDSDPFIQSCIFTDNDADTNGGAISLEESEPTFVECNFINNEAIFNGGGMYISYSSPTVEDCIFSGNDALQEGGAICMLACNNLDLSPDLHGCTFVNNYADYQGGGIYFNNSIANVSDCIFDQNGSGYGAGLAISSASAIDVVNTTFNRNETYQNGGAVWNNASWICCSSTFTDCLFTANATQYDGGAMWFGHNAKSTLINCDFENNTALADGAGIFSFETPDLVNCVFDNNWAQGNGGGIYNNGGISSELTDCDFKSNTAELGGGMYIGGADANPALTNCIFESNNADSGGGIYVYWGTPTLESCVFNGNVSSIKGGAIYNDSLSSNNLTVTNSSFTGNSSMSLDVTTNFGGAFYNSGYAELSNCEFSDNSSGYGGAFHTSSAGETLLSNCEVKRNIAKVCGGASFSLQGYIASQETLYCGNLPDHLVGGWVDLGDNELVDTCPSDEIGFCRSDCNQDYNVDILDLLYLIAVWDTSNPAGDINDDGWVDVEDLLVLISDWGTDCEQPSAS